MLQLPQHWSIEEKTKPLSNKLMIISGFSRPSYTGYTGKGPPTSWSHLTAGGSFVEVSIMIVFYSWLLKSISAQPDYISVTFQSTILKPHT